MLLLSVGSRRDDPRAWIVAKDDGRTRRQLEEVGQLLELAAAATRRAPKRPCAVASSSIGWARIRMRWRSSKRDRTKRGSRRLLARVDPGARAPRARAGPRRRSRRSSAPRRSSPTRRRRPWRSRPSSSSSATASRRWDGPNARGRRPRTATIPWPQYWSGSGRFLERWLADLRGVSAVSAVGWRGAASSSRWLGLTAAAQQPIFQLEPRRRSRSMSSVKRDGTAGDRTDRA